MSAVDASPLLVLAVLVFLLVVVLLGRRLDVRVGSIHAELRPNGGSSLRDAVDRIERRVTKLEDRIESDTGS